MSGASGPRDLERRLRALEDRNALLDLEAAYAVSSDTNQPERWAELFTADGVFEMLAAGALPHMRFEGREALAGFCRTIDATWSGHALHAPATTRHRRLSGR